MSRDRRAVLVGGAVVLASWLVLRAAPAGLNVLRRTEDLVAQRAELVGRASERVGGVAQLDDSIRALDEVTDALPRMILVGGDAETAAVDLMRRIRELLASKRASLLGFEARREGATLGPLTLAAVTVKIETDFVELLEIVLRMEDDPALAIESLDARAVDPHADSTQAERLTVEVGVSGWYRPTPAAAADSQGAPIEVFTR